MSDNVRPPLPRKGVSATAAACVFALVQGCALQPAQPQASSSYVSSDSGSSDSGAAASKPAGQPQWAKGHGHEGNPYFRTATSTSEGSVTVEGNTIHYHAVAGLLI